MRIKRVLGWASLVVRRPAAALGAWTLFVFVSSLSLGLGLTTFGQQSCNPPGWNFNQCLWGSGGSNACNMTSCAPSGSGYSCSAPYGTVMAWHTERCWRLSPTFPWPVCSGTSSTAPSCGNYEEPCGGMAYYYGVSPCSNQNCGYPCTDNWYWQSCKAIGTPCGSGTGTGGAGGS